MNVPVMRNASSDTENSSKGSLVVYTIAALGLAIFIRFVVAAPYIVSGASMENTFQDFNYLIVDRLSYDFGDPRRGDVIVFDLPQDTGRSLIKRVIGLPGETIILNGATVTIVNSEYPDGFTLSEPYLSPENLGGSSNMRITLAPDHVCAIGNNPRVPADSRLWGALPREDIVGRVFLRLFPLNEVSVLPGEARYSN